MPTVALLLLGGALGLVTASLLAHELRASTRSVVETEGFRALAVHAAAIGFPSALFLLLRHTDWMVSYAFDGARLPSAVALLLALGAAATPLLGFTLGASWVRTHDTRRPWIVAASAVAVVFVGSVALRARVFHVGSWIQFRGGFGLDPLGRSALSPVLSVTSLAQLGAWVWMLWVLTRRRAR